MIKDSHSFSILHDSGVVFLFIQPGPLGSWPGVPSLWHRAVLRHADWHTTRHRDSPLPGWDDQGPVPVDQTHSQRMSRRRWDDQRSVHEWVPVHCTWTFAFGNAGTLYKHTHTRQQHATQMRGCGKSGSELCRSLCWIHWRFVSRVQACCRTTYSSRFDCLQGCKYCLRSRKAKIKSESSAWSEMQHKHRLPHPLR